MDKKTAIASVDKRPSPQVLGDLRGERTAHPKVQQQELARRLGVYPSQLSAFENGNGALPRDLTVEDYRSALADLKRAKRMDGAA